MGIAILGAGCWGTALASLIAKNSPNEPVWLWGRSQPTQNLQNVHFTSNLHFSDQLDLILENASNLLVAVPSNAFRDLMAQLAVKSSCTNKRYRIAWATKGMDRDSNKFFSEVIKDYFDQNLPMAILSGPSFAQEVIDQDPTAVVLSFSRLDQEFGEYLSKKLQSAYFKLYCNHDLIGVQLGGVFKNILAVAVGISEGLGFAANTSSAIIARGFKELLELGEKLQVDPKTLSGLSGLGDLVLTCSSNKSRNRRFGVLLGKGSSVVQAKEQIGQAIEALDNIESIYNLANNYNLVMPIVSTVRGILNEELLLSAVIDLFLDSKSGFEY